MGIVYTDFTGAGKNLCPNYPRDVSLTSNRILQPDFLTDISIVLTVRFMVAIKVTLSNYHIIILRRNTETVMANYRTYQLTYLYDVYGTNMGKYGTFQ